MNQTGISVPKVPTKATGHVDRYVFIAGPYGNAKLTVAEARQLRKDLADAIKTAGE